MKKLFAAILMAATLAMTSVPVLAATTPYICPNGNNACVQNGACLTNGSCVNHQACTENDTCLYPEGCPNGGVAERSSSRESRSIRDGYGRGHGRGHGMGHCGGGRNR